MFGEENEEVENEEVATVEVKKEPKKHPIARFFKNCILCVIFGAIFGACAAGTFYLVGDKLPGKDKKPEQKQEQIQVTPTATELLSKDEDEEEEVNVTFGESEKVTVITTDVTDMVENVMPCMVIIMNNYTATSDFWGSNYEKEAQASGTGIIIGQSDTELVIATNQHVVEKQNKLEVTFINGTSAKAEMKGFDKSMDLAVIAVSLEDLDEDTKNAIAVARLGDSDELKLGAPVVAIGNAMGYGQSVTGGYVSALNREIEFNDGSKGYFIQTDAAINPGNSGGALLNIQGEVIGINSSKIGGDTIEGIGFAIPISTAKPIIEELMKNETKHRNETGKTSFIGVEVSTITERAVENGIYPRGVMIRSVEEDGPAAQAGMEAGDIVVKFGEDKITSSEELIEALRYYEPGTTVKVVVKRKIDEESEEYEDVELTLTLGERS